jgi:hypothetical protein
MSSGLYHVIYFDHVSGEMKGDELKCPPEEEGAVVDRQINGSQTSLRSLLFGLLIKIRARFGDSGGGFT